MKQLLILSGKGGTGKTTVATAFIKLSDVKAYADCDVDAPNLHLLMDQSTGPIKSDYYGLPKAEIDINKCIKCDICRENCRFEAIELDSEYSVNYFNCEGCGVCEALCPVGAASLKPAVAGEIKLYKDEKVFSTAQLKMGSGTSGKLVTQVKEKMKSAVDKVDLAIIDGSPGIGCPVIASLSGVDMVLIVAEPSISGISDMERILMTAENFQIKAAVCVNKFDTNEKNTERIELFCKDRQLPFVGKIPFDPQAVKAINRGKSIVDIDCISGQGVKEIYENIITLLFSES